MERQTDRQTVMDSISHSLGRHFRERGKGGGGGGPADREGKRGKERTVSKANICMSVY